MLQRNLSEAIGNNYSPINHFGDECKAEIHCEQSILMPYLDELLLLIS